MPTSSRLNNRKPVRGDVGIAPYNTTKRRKTMLYNIFKAFWVGGILCVIAQIIIDKTKLTPARIMVSYVVAGAFLTLIGVYDPIVKYAGAGATVPIIGFGYSLCKGAIKAVNEKGLMGVMTGGITATAGGITAAILFGYLAALFSKPRLK